MRGCQGTLLLSSCLLGCYDPRLSGLDATLPPAPDSSGPDDADVGADGPSDSRTSDASAWCPGNLVPNAGFEADLDGWEGVNCAISRISDALDGTGALLACRLADGQAHDCRVRAVDGTIATFAVGSLYRVTAWTRADDDETDRPVGPRLRYIDGIDVGATQNEMLVTTSWFQLDLYLSVPAAPDAIELWFSMPDTEADPTVCYRLDDVCLRATPTGTVTAPPPPAPSRR